MKINIGLLVFLILASCSHPQKPKPVKPIIRKPVKAKVIADTTDKPLIQYSNQQLISYLDSIGKLPTQPLADKVSFGADSAFNNLTKPYNRRVSTADIEIIKKAGKAKCIEAHEAMRIFGELKTDVACNTQGLIYSLKKGFVYFSLLPLVQIKTDQKNLQYGLATRNIAKDRKYIISKETVS